MVGVNNEGLPVGEILFRAGVLGVRSALPEPALFRRLGRADGVGLDGAPLAQAKFSRDGEPLSCIEDEMGTARERLDGEE